MDGNPYTSSPSNPDNHDLTPQVMKGEKEKDIPSNSHVFNMNIVDGPGVGASGTKVDLLPALDCVSENSSELRRRRDDLNYPPRYPDLQRVSLSEATNANNPIDISPMDIGFVSDSDDDSEDTTDEFHDKPSFRGVVEWIMCFLFDCALLVVEVGISLWLASSLYDYDNNLKAPYTAILIIIFLPCFINPILWLKLKASYKLSTCFLFILLLLPPAPLFVYIWHLYLSMFAKRSDAEKAKSIADKFRIIQAFVTSVPLLLLNIITLINALKVDSDKDALDISYLADHLHEVEMHGLALILSLINLIRASALFNERETFTLLFVLVSCPFLLLTAIARIVSFGIIIAFLDVTWIAILVLGLIFGNIGVYMLCRKRNQQRYYNARASTHLVPPASAPSCIDDVDHAVTIVGKRSSKKNIAKNMKSKYLSPITQKASSSSLEPALDNIGCDNLSNVSHNSNIYKHGCSAHCCGTAGRGSPDSETGGRNRSYTYAINPENPQKGLQAGNSKSAGTIIISNTHDDSVWSNMPKTILLSICSIVMPCGYSNDSRYEHPRLKGGLFLMLNFFITNVVLGVALGFSILRHVPNTFRGVQLPPLAAKIKIPQSSLNVELGGLFGVELNLDGKDLNLGEMPPMDADINLGARDHLLAVVAPLILTMVVLPFATMRSALMELDCFIARRKSLVDLERVQRHKRIQKRKRQSPQQYASTPTNSSGHSSSRVLIRNNQTLVESVAKNTENKELKGRMYVTLCCSVVGMAIMTFVSMFLGVLIYVSMYKLS